MSTEPVAVQNLPAQADAGEEATVFSAGAETVFTAPALPVTRTDAPRVEAFIHAHGLGEWVNAAVRLLPEFFPEAVGVHLQMSWEAPGEYGEGLVADIRLPPGAADAVRRCRQFLLRWVRARPVWVGDVMCFGTRYVSAGDDGQ